MEYTLVIDRGNSAIKAAVFNTFGDIVLFDVAAVSVTAGALVSQLAKELLATDDVFNNAIYSSVVASKRDTDIASLAKLCPKLLTLTAQTPLPIIIDYATPNTLGVDRIAAVVGAQTIVGNGKAVLIADIGTAVTYEFLSADGHYIGGNIAPGVNMRLGALHSFTDVLPLVSANGQTPQWGQSTPEAIRSGAIRGIVAELEYYHHIAGDDAKVILTGGTADLLVKSDLISFEFIHEPFLVMKGLNSILIYNETK